MKTERYFELDQGHWNGLKADPSMYFGFIYMIEHKASGKLYIGKKQYWSAVNKAGCKSRVTDRQSSKWKPQCWRESDWRYYKGSSNKLSEFMRKHPSDEYEYTILKECRSKGSLHFDELWELWSRDVLRAKDKNGEYQYWNISIGAIKFRPPEYVSDVTRANMRAAQRGRVVTKEHRDKISKSWENRTVSEETKKKMRGNTNAKGHKVPDEVKAKLARVASGHKHTDETKRKLRDLVSDKTIYRFENKVTGEVFTGTRVDFCEAFNLGSSAVSKVIRGVRRSTMNWFLIKGGSQIGE